MSALFSTLGSAAGIALKIGQENIVPILNGAAKLGQEHIVPVLLNPGPAAVRAGNWVANHPGQTALYAINGATLAFPGLLAAPILGAFGFGAAGVLPASVAAGIQATSGTVAAGGTFATLTSYGMGGYGVAVVNSVVRAGAAMFGAAGVGAVVAS